MRGSLIGAAQPKKHGKPLHLRTSERIPARNRKISARLPLPRFPPPLAPSDQHNTVTTTYHTSTQYATRKRGEKPRGITKQRRPRQDGPRATKWSKIERQTSPTTLQFTQPRDRKTTPSGSRGRSRYATRWGTKTLLRIGEGRVTPRLGKPSRKHPNPKQHQNQ